MYYTFNIWISHKMDNKLRSIKQRRDNQLPTEYIDNMRTKEMVKKL